MDCNSIFQLQEVLKPLTHSWREQYMIDEVG